MPKVSVLIPNYNGGNYIGEAIESILGQTFTNFECIIVDDCSTDTSWTTIQEYQKQDTRIRCYQNKKNLGISHTRNRLIDLAQGEYMAWLDSDDMARSDRLGKQVQFLDNHTNHGIVGSWITLIDATGKILGIRKLPIHDTEIKESFYYRNPLGNSSIMMRMTCVKKVGHYLTIFNEGAEDLDFSLRASQYFKLANIPDTLVQYRLHGKNISLKKQKKQIQNTLLIRKNIEKMGYKMGLIGKGVQCITWCVQFLPASLVMKSFNWGIKILNKYLKKDF